MYKFFGNLCWIFEKFGKFDFKNLYARIWSRDQKLGGRMLIPDIDFNQITSLKQAHNIIKMLIERIERLQSKNVELHNLVNHSTKDQQKTNFLDTTELAWFNFGDPDSWDTFQKRSMNNSQSDYAISLPNINLTPQEYKQIRKIAEEKLFDVKKLISQKEYDFLIEQTISEIALDIGFGI